MTEAKSNIFGRKTEGKQFHMATPETARPNYKKVLISFIDQSETVIERTRLCTYIADKLQELVLELKKVYKEVTILKSKDGIERIQCKLDEGVTVDESFQKVRAYRI